MVRSRNRVHMTTNTPYESAGSLDDVGLRLVCLPHAGGGSASFYRWRDAVGSRLAVVPVCYPGREGRINEPLPTDLRSLAAEIVDSIEPFVRQPYALLGHSLGAWIALEMARELRCREWPLPVLIVAAASRAPSAMRTSQPLHQLPDAEFVAEVSRQFGGMPPVLRANDDLLKLLLPILRADVRLLETYQFEEQPPLEVDVLAIGGTDDRAVTLTDLSGWRRHTSRKFSMRLVPGDHFFLLREDGGETKLPAALKMIVGRLDSYLSR